jgi:hypothetical protein
MHQVRALVSALAAALIIALPIQAAPKPSPKPSPNTAGTLQWYDLTAQTVAASGITEQSSQGRLWALSWIAAARAVGYVSDLSFETPALATALHDTLVGLVPGQKAQLDAALGSTLTGVPDGPAKARGIAAGQREAATILAKRKGDGLDQTSVNAPYTPLPPGPGVWQPTPPTFGPAIRAGLSKGRPFAIQSAGQFRPGPPPALDSKTYLDALTEVRTTGSATSTVRTAEQTDVARFWEQNSIDAYAQVLRAVLAGSTRSFGWGARLVAIFHAVTLDEQIAVYDAKYTYTFWRPVTAIRTGSVDSDPSWTPFFATPRHPEYPSGHAAYAGAAEKTLSFLVGARPVNPISLTSATDPGVTRNYTDWSTITQENVDGRVWEGIHFRFSDLTAAALGRQVAAYDVAHLPRILG